MGLLSGLRMEGGIKIFHHFTLKKKWLMLDGYEGFHPFSLVGNVCNI